VTTRRKNACYYLVLDVAYLAGQFRLGLADAPYGLEKFVRLAILQTTNVLTMTGTAPLVVVSPSSASKRAAEIELVD